MAKEILLFDTEWGVLHFDDGKVELTPLEYDFVGCLFRHLEHPVSFREIGRRLWHYPNKEGVAQLASKVRRKIGQLGLHGPDYLKTARGYRNGYYLKDVALAPFGQAKSRKGPTHVIEWDKPEPPTDPWESLTDTEYKIFLKLGDKDKARYTYREWARELGIEVNTFKHHLKNIYRKLSVKHPKRRHTIELARRAQAGHHLVLKEVAA